MFEKRKEGASGNSAEHSTDKGTAKESRLGNRSPGSSEAKAVIGSSIRVKGEITGDEDLLVEGSIDGSVNLPGHEVTIGQSGEVSAEVRANKVRVEGQVSGDITGVEKVIITRSGRVIGDIMAPRVTLEDGAKFKGRIDMHTPVEEAVPKAVPKRSAAVSNTEAVGEKRTKSGT